MNEVKEIYIKKFVDIDSQHLKRSDEITGGCGEATISV